MFKNSYIVQYLSFYSSKFPKYPWFSPDWPQRRNSDWPRRHHLRYKTRGSTRQYVINIVQERNDICFSNSKHISLLYSPFLTTASCFLWFYDGDETIVTLLESLYIMIQNVCWIRRWWRNVVSSIVKKCPLFMHTCQKKMHCNFCYQIGSIVLVVFLLGNTQHL